MHLILNIFKPVIKGVKGILISIIGWWPETLIVSCDTFKWLALDLNSHTDR